MFRHKKFLTPLKSPVFYLIRILNTLLPKRKNRIFFYSYPDFSDNSYFLYKYINKAHKEKFEIVWGVRRSDLVNCSYIDKKSIADIYTLRYFYYLFTSKFVFFTHGLPPGASRKQIVVYLGHLAAPIKNWEYFEKDKRVRQEVLKRKKLIDYYISTSKFSRLVLSATMNADPQKILVTGLPRNDTLFKTTNHLRKFCGINNSNKKIIMYIPTFRKKIDSDVNLDNIKVKNSSPSIILRKLEKHKKFSKFLENNNFLLVCKFHPYNESQLVDIDSNHPNIHILKNDWFSKNNITLNEILNEVDILVTDYSSVYFDFLLLDRPMFFLCPDVINYAKKKGFLYSPIEFWLPGPLTFNIDEFVQSLILSEKDSEKYTQQRNTLKNIFHEYQDSKSSSRVFHKILRKTTNLK